MRDSIVPRIILYIFIIVLSILISVQDIYYLMVTFLMFVVLILDIVNTQNKDK